MPERVEETQVFEQDVEALLDPKLRKAILGILQETLLHKAEFGQRVRGTARIQIWPVFQNDGLVYIAYYRVEGDTVVLLRMIKRATPLSPRLLDLDED